MPAGVLGAQTGTGQTEQEDAMGAGTILREPGLEIQQGPAGAAAATLGTVFADEPSWPRSLVAPRGSLLVVWALPGFVAETCGDSAVRDVV